MKKRIAIVCTGMLLAVSSSVYGTSIVEMIGKKVDSTYPIYVNGKKLNQDVIVIEGVSYIPVRVAAQRFGYKTEFSNNEVRLNSMIEFEVIPPTDLSKIRVEIPKERKPYQEIVEFLPVNNSVFEVNREHNYLKYNEKVYLPLGVLSRYASLNIETKELDIDIPELFQGKFTITQNMNEFIEASGQIFMNLELIGLKTDVRDNTIYIDKLD